MFFVDYFHDCIKYLALRHTRKQDKSATHAALLLTIGLDNYLKSQILISNSIIDSSHKFLWIEIFHLRKSKPFLS